MAKKSKHKQIGRPRRVEEVSEESVTIRLSSHEKQVLQEYAWRYNMTSSDVIRFCLDILGVW